MRSLLGTNRTNAADVMMSVVRGRPEATERMILGAIDPLRTSVSTSFYGCEAGFRPINVLVLADMMLLPDHEGDP
jgi:hypothetical protein